jgi:large subunit ribosomal protein L35
LSGQGDKSCAPPFFRQKRAIERCLKERKEAVMPKMKTNKSAKKRFRVSGSGRVRRSKAGGNHLMQEKSRKRVRRARNNDMVDKTLEKKIKSLIPYG